MLQKVVIRGLSDYVIEMTGDIYVAIWILFKRSCLDCCLDLKVKNFPQPSEFSLKWLHEAQKMNGRKRSVRNITWEWRVLNQSAARSRVAICNAAVVEELGALRGLGAWKAWNAKMTYRLGSLKAIFGRERRCPGNGFSGKVLTSKFIMPKEC
jgi:hypothetical protein